MCWRRLQRLISIVSLYQEKQEDLAQVRAMREWVINVEHILDGSWASKPEEMSNAEVGRRLDDWLKQLAEYLQGPDRTDNSAIS
jgi:hypothetical protein